VVLWLDRALLGKFTFKSLTSLRSVKEAENEAPSPASSLVRLLFRKGLICFAKYDLIFPRNNRYNRFSSENCSGLTGGLNTKNIIQQLGESCCKKVIKVD
jgi:hypothetical protein